MPLISFSYQDFINLLGYPIPQEEFIEKIPMIGADLDSMNGDEINIEFFPNRPDLTSVEGIARAARSFFGFEPGLKQYPVQSSDIQLIVEPSVKNVRPYVTIALIKNITMTDELIRSLMDLQEKLHGGLGRNRRKVAIGVHNFEPVQPPFTYKAVDPDSVQFIPLAKEEPMTLREILTKHEKGIDYAYILEQHTKYPLIVDKNNNVLSFPPIINGKLTEVTPYTKDIFIDVTGTDNHAINYALNIITTALAERGGILYTTTVQNHNKQTISPDFTPQPMTLSKDYVNRILGTHLTDHDIITALKKMGFDANKKSSETIQVHVPAWRSDVIHEIDLVEDVAIGYGFIKFTDDFPTTLTIGKTLPNHELYENMRTIMIGLGFNEVTTFTISNPTDEFTNLQQQPGNMVIIENPIGEEYSGLRISLLPSLLKLIQENKHHPLPQQIFEIGIIVDEHAKNRVNLAAVKIDAKANFTECKSLIETVVRNLGQPASFQEKKHAAFIAGRCASLMQGNHEIGYFGELHPQTIINFKLEHPIIAFELFADIIKTK